MTNAELLKIKQALDIPNYEHMSNAECTVIDEAIAIVNAEFEKRISSDPEEQHS